MNVKGYTEQSDTNVGAVNRNKAMEEQVLRVIDLYQTYEGIDKRWLSIARTHIEQGFMAMNRSIFQPKRLTDEDMAGFE